MCWEICCQSLKEDVMSQDFKQAIKVFFLMVVHVKPLDSLKISTCHACFSGRWLGIVWFWFFKPFTHFKRSRGILENVSISVKKNLLFNLEPKMISWFKTEKKYHHTWKCFKFSLKKSTCQSWIMAPLFGSIWTSVLL